MVTNAEVSNYWVTIVYLIRSIKHQTDMYGKRERESASAARKRLEGTRCKGDI